MTSTLYSRDILRLATMLVSGERLGSPDATAETRSPTCGSMIETDICCDEGGALSAIAFRANACALGQASAAILRANAVGHDCQSLEQVRAGLADCLKGEADAPVIWPDLATLEVARDYPARHAAILLPYDAVLAAFQKPADQYGN